MSTLAAYGSEAAVVDEIMERFTSRIDDARAFAPQNRVVLLRAHNDVPVDVALGALDFESRAVRRASPWNVGEVSLTTCGAEDLVVHKVFAGRDRDWLDVEGIVVRQGEALDRDRVLDELNPLLELKGSVDDIQRLRAVL